MPAETAKTVLIVDDDDEVRRFVSAVLATHGYRVVQSATGCEALSLAHEDDRPSIDVLVTDISLIGADGITLAERVIAHFPGIGVVFMSGFAEVPRGRLDGLAARWVFVPKPFHLRRLLDAVHSVLDETGGARAA
jgi:two-component system, cell cycle sensor histidine kinase and response regulator CckA